MIGAIERVSPVGGEIGRVSLAGGGKFIGRHSSEIMNTIKGGIIIRLGIIFVAKIIKRKLNFAAMAIRRFSGNLFFAKSCISFSQIENKKD